MRHTLSIASWVSLPNEVRYKIRSIFDIPKSSFTHVDGGRVVSDGVTHDDLAHLTVPKMQTYLSIASEDFLGLFDAVVARVNDELYPKMVDESVLARSNDSVTVIIEPVTNLRKRKTANTTKNASRE